MLNFMVMHTILFFITSISAIFTKIAHPIFVYTFSIIACPLLWSARTYKHIFKIIYIELSLNLHKISQFSTDHQYEYKINVELTILFFITSISAIFSKITHPIFINAVSIITCPFIWSTRACRLVKKIKLCVFFVVKQ